MTSKSNAGTVKKKKNFNKMYQALHQYKLYKLSYLWVSYTNHSRLHKCLLLEYVTSYLINCLLKRAREEWQCSPNNAKQCAFMQEAIVRGETDNNRPTQRSPISTEKTERWTRSKSLRFNRNISSKPQQLQTHWEQWLKSKIIQLFKQPTFN